MAMLDPDGVPEEYFENKSLCDEYKELRNALAEFWEAIARALHLVARRD